MKKTAIALHYPEGAPAPFVVCKGSGNIAEQILALAQENNVPIVCEPETALILSLQEVGDCVSPETYGVLVGIFAFLKKVESYEHN